MKARNPALVYTPGATDDIVGRIDKYLHEQNLYRFDDVQEPTQDLALPAVERPVLLRVMLHATMYPPMVFITDHQSSLGSDEITQTAVIGALLDSDVDVRIMDEPVTLARYQRAVQTLGYQNVGPIIEGLLNPALITEPILRRWAEICGGSMFLPTSIRRNMHLSRLKIKELVELDGLSFTEIATRLSVGGYQNSHERVTWFTQAVRDTYEAGL